MLIISLFMMQIQVEAERVCCPNNLDRKKFDLCSATGFPKSACARLSECKIFPGNTCPSDFPANRLETSADAVAEYCKLGCTSSVCGPLTTFLNSGASEIGDGAVDHCVKACSTFCTNGSTKIAAETA
ncbi:hypothetical protein N665_0066s0018 [Sinapis alba]|nr:hypothetical protein N665_0066s0018 [Sinapis alba]